MCGIVGVLQYESEVPKETRDKVLRILFSDIMIRTEVRGEDATGVYQVHTNGDWMMTKKGVKSSDWIYDSDKSDDEMTYPNIMDSWSEHNVEMSALVGHCRKATVGSKGKDNDDNHPFAIQLDEQNALLGIHNGTLNNHEVIFDKLPEGLERLGSTDSEVLFHFLYHLTERGTQPITGEVIQELGRRLDGAYACITVNSKFPNLVGTFRENRPMEYYMISPLNIVLIVSEKKFAQGAFDNYRFIRKFMDPDLPELLYDDKTLAEKDWRIFDTSLPFPEGKPSFSDWAKISTTGVIKPHQHKVDDEWKKTTTTTTSGTNTSTGTKYSGGTNTGTKQGTGTASKTATGTAATVRASKADTKSTAPASKITTKDADDDGVTVEGEVIEVALEDTVPKKTMDRVKSLGLCLHYDSLEEINQALALEPSKSAADMTAMDIANSVGKLHFALGYATSKFDGKKERDEMKSHTQDLLPKLELALDKKGKAEAHIWEHKQLLLFMTALSAEGFSLDMRNVEICLSAFPGLSLGKQEGILEAARKLFSDEGSKKMVKQLRDEFKKAEDRGKAKTLDSQGSN